MKRSNLILVTLITLISLPSFSSEEWKGRIYKEDGVQVVESKGKGIWGERIGEKILFKETLSLGVEEGDENQIFGGRLYLSVDSDGNIYILDPQNHRILKFGKDGKLIWKTGRKGQGPGEFQNPYKIRVKNKDTIAVLDEEQIHFFSQDGKFLRTLKIGKWIGDFEFLRDGRIFLSLLPKGQAGYTAEYYSEDGKFISKFPAEYFYGPKFSPNLGASGGSAGFVLSDDRLFLCLPDKYEIREYDLNGNLLRKIRRDLPINPPEIKILADGHGISVRSHNFLGPSFILKNGILVNQISIFKEKNTESFLDFFDREGKFLGSLKIKEDYLVVTDENDNFYFVQYAPFPKIIRKSIKINF